MRRKEFEITDEKEISELLHFAGYAILGLIDPDGDPYTVPLNFAYLNGSIYFHCAAARNDMKIKCISLNDRASLSVIQEFSFIPSYFSDSMMACNAGQFFKSIFMKGNISVVNDKKEVVIALEALMQKYQPESGYEPISETHPEYRKELNATNVLKFFPDTITAKFKFGQNLKDEDFQKRLASLEARGNPIDLDTIRMMKRYRNYKNI